VLKRSERCEETHFEGDREVKECVCDGTDSEVACV
jgi:hypothetical protein